MTGQDVPSVPDPPGRVVPLTESWPAGRPLYRVHDRAYAVTAFNPGPRPRARFAFFGAPPVSVLYAGEDEEVAVAESLLHDLDGPHPRVPRAAHLAVRGGACAPRRALRLATLHSRGLYALGLEPRRLTDTHPVRYAETVRWAEAIHRDNDVDGLVWMSRRWNTRRAVVLFGDRVAQADLEALPAAVRDFALPADFEWLAALCHELGIEIQPPW